MIVAIYTGNLIAFLVVDSVVLPFTNLAEMVAQSEYQWGVVKSYACEQIFRVDIGGGERETEKGGGGAKSHTSWLIYNIDTQLCSFKRNDTTTVGGGGVASIMNTFL